MSQSERKTTQFRGMFVWIIYILVLTHLSNHIDTYNKKVSNAFHGPWTKATDPRQRVPLILLIIIELSDWNLSIWTITCWCFLYKQLMRDKGYQCYYCRIPSCSFQHSLYKGGLTLWSLRCNDQNNSSKTNVIKCFYLINLNQLTFLMYAVPWTEWTVIKLLQLKIRSIYNCLFSSIYFHPNLFAFTIIHCVGSNKAKLTLQKHF